MLGNPEGSPWMLAHPGWETLPSLHGWVIAPASFPLPSPLLFLYSHFYMMLADIKFFFLLFGIYFLSSVPLINSIVLIVILHKFLIFTGSQI